jgi:hypothetical protein
LLAAIALTAKCVKKLAAPDDNAGRLPRRRLFGSPRCRIYNLSGPPPAA